MSREVRPTSGALRAFNRASVVQVMRRRGWVTRSTLVEQTGLSRATVSTVLGELGARGLIAERPPASSSGRGRPATEVALDKSAGTAIAVDIGVRHVAVAVGDLSHSVLAERWDTMPRGHTAERGMRTVLRSIEDAVSQAGVDPDELVGAAVSVAAPVATDSARFAVPGVLPGWNESLLSHSVSDRWGVPVVTENDANLGALAEAMAPRAPLDGDLLFVKLASRIGLGIVRGRRIVRGRSGYAGEFGHVTARAGGDLCWCGRRGCLELYAGGDGMLRRVAAGTAADTTADTAAGAPAGPAPGSIAELVERAPGSREIRAVVADAAAALARALADVTVLLDPARIVLGGELAALGDLLEAPIRRELQSLPFGSPVELSISPLGERASLVGALSLVLTEPVRFADRAQPRDPQHRAPSPARRTSLPDSLVSGATA